MYFRTKRIKNTMQLQLIESFRDGEGRPRQRIVASLGGGQLPPGRERTIARSVEWQLRGLSAGGENGGEREDLSQGE